jgi:hypothetical protein
VAQIRRTLAPEGVVDIVISRYNHHMTTKQLPVRLPEDVYNQLKATSFFLGCSMNEIVTDAVERHLAGLDDAVFDTALAHGKQRYAVVLDKLRAL